MAEMRASPVVNPRLKRIAEVLADLQGPMGQIIPGTDFNPFQVLMPQASTFENLAYGNSPFSEYSGVTNRRLPIVKTGREDELTDIADVALMASGVPAVSRGVARGANYLGDVMTQAVTRNPQATSMRALNEISQMSPFPQVAPQRIAPTPVKSDLGFYSQLEAATLPLQNKGTGQQYLAQIAKTPGVKPEELQWTGLSEFLENKPSVTRDEILNYLNTNRVDVQEVRLGEMSQEQLLAQQQAKNRYREITDAVADTRQKAEEGLLSSQEARAILEPLTAERSRLDNQFFSNAAPATKFSQYTLPGGENYREILLTLPETKGPSADEMSRQMFGRRFNQLSFADQEVVRAQARENSSANFRSSHFDQPNILAHMRVNDRVVDGKKTLFIEEIQSDWHQAGRKKGYQRAKDLTLNDVDLRFVQSDVPEGADPSVYPGYYEAFDKQTGEFLGRHSGTLNREQAMRDAVMSANQFQTGVPNAPFKTSWHELSLKRAIQEASEKGYDQIAFTTGKTQAERYDLSKQISRVVYNEPGSKRANKFGTVLYAYDKNGDQVIGKSVAPEELADYIGKEAADKLMKAEADSWGQKELAGVDLQVGGEGMKGFYDNILPKSLDKLAKKFDAKVGKTFIEGERTRDASGIPSMYPEKIEVWSMDITPKMRESVTTKGQPLFAVPAIGTGLLGAGMMEEDPMAQFLNYQ
jgi:hypothetical protein